MVKCTSVVVKRTSAGITVEYSNDFNVVKRETHLTEYPLRTGEKKLTPYQFNRLIDVARAMSKFEVAIDCDSRNNEED